MARQTSLFDGPSGRCACCGQRVRSQAWRWTQAQKDKTLREARALASAGVPTKWLSRADGPESSRLSAVRGAPRRPSHRLRLLYSMMKHGPMTVRECATRAGYDYEKSGSWKRFSELKQMGLVSPTGQQQHLGGNSPAEIYESQVST